MADYDRTDADEFLDNVNNITSRIHDILEGKTDVIEEEERFQEAARLKKVKKEIRERERLEELNKGIKGKGYKGNFLTFCKGCHTEYHHEAVEICNNCGKATISKEVSFSPNDLTRRMFFALRELSGIFFNNRI